MIDIEVDKSGQGVEVYMDSDGIEEFINYLRYIKSNQEHMHLLAGNELGETLINEKNRKIKHVNLIFHDN